MYEPSLHLQAQIISYCSNIHEKLWVQIAHDEIFCVYILTRADERRRKQGSLFGILCYFSKLLARNTCCVGVRGSEMNDDSSVSSCVKLSLFLFMMMLCFTIALFCVYLFVCLCAYWKSIGVFCVCARVRDWFPLYGSLLMWFVPFYTDCLWVIYDSNI